MERRSADESGCSNTQPSSIESPQVEPIIVESIDPEGRSRKECSEGSLRRHSAIANAIYDASDSTARMSFHAERVLAALRRRRMPRLSS